MASRIALIASTALFFAVGTLLSLAAALQNPVRPGDIELPPITFLCPMNGAVMPDGSIHSDVYEDKAGSCPVCNMALTATRLDSIWTCPVHSVVAERKGGVCPIDKRELVRVTVAVTWTCAARPDIDQLTPGNCPDGSAMTVKYTPRAHGNHNPQHGGQFFMAPDNWTHLEGTLPQDRLVRIYLYDDYTKPLPREKLRAVQGRIITKAGAGGTSFPLVLGRSGQYLEARVDKRALPAALVARLRLKSGGPEYQFDFTFTELTREPSASAPNAVVKVAAPPVIRPAPTASLQPAEAVSVGATSTPTQVDIPATVAEIVAQIASRNRHIGELVESGRFAEVWLPAFEAKDLALAITDHAAELQEDKRRLLDPAIRRLLNAAWLLDAFGDFGNRQQIAAASTEFSAAVSAIESLVQGTQER